VIIAFSKLFEKEILKKSLDSYKKKLIFVLAFANNCKHHGRIKAKDVLEKKS